MESSRCSKCALVQWADNGTCKRCGFPLEASLSNSFGANPYQPAQSGMYGQQQLKTGLAIASMVVAIIAFPTTFLLIGLLLAPVAVVMGIVALRRASKQPNVYGGKGFAIAGIAVGSVVCVFFVPVIAAIAIPNLLASRRAANEGSALRTLEVIALAQNKHASTDADGECGDLMTLATKNLVDAEVGSGRKNGYRFVAGGNASDTYECEVRATPQSPDMGSRSFYYSSSDDIIRAATAGKAADHDAEPLTRSRASR